MPLPKSQRRRVQVRGSVDYTNEDIRNVRYLMPKGSIIMWSGARTTIPEGWVECDGSNGSPDLREKFIKGVAAAGSPGGTGGSATHTPTGTNSAPTFTGSALAGHTHGVGTYVMGAPDRTVALAAGAILAGDDVHVHTLSGSSESVTAGTPAGTVSAPTFTGDSQNTEPAYYTLIFLYKL